jgi:predicted N-acetyltransferase YhbS
MTDKLVFSTLRQRPDLREATIALIEKSFSYQKDQKFDVDFAPLIAEENASQCHIIFEQETNEVVAHVGYLKRDLMINNRCYPVGLVGGVCVADSHRGQGLFSRIFDKINRFHGDSIGIFMLWSDKPEYYEKFDFHLCIEQQEVTKSGKPSTGFEKTKYHLLDIKQKMHVKKLYRDNVLGQYSSFQRSEKDWQQLEKITSTDLYVKKDKEGSIVGYFFMNKGQDLNGVVHEIAVDSNYEDVFAYGTVWTGPGTKADKSETHYGSLVRVSNLDIFRRMVFDYTNEQVILLSLDKGIATFEYKKTRYEFPIARFLTGLWGPHTFEEFEFETKPLYISGLDSI